MPTHHRGLDRILGSLSDFPDVLAVVRAITGRQTRCLLPDGSAEHLKILDGAECFAVDYGACRYIEQNRKDGSVAAGLVHDGIPIIWVWQTCDVQLGFPLPQPILVGMVEGDTVRAR